MQESVTTAQERVQQGSKAMFGLEPIIFWGWLFFILYMWLMVGFGFIGMSRVQNSDDFATAH
jgi:hypothetical protein